jgi:hypothetical protein
LHAISNQALRCGICLGTIGVDFLPMEFYVAADGKQEGPLTEEEVRQLITNRALKPTDHCWMDGWADWRPLQDAFAEEFRAAEPAPLASWETLANEPAPDAASLRRRLPIRHDRTSAGIFAVVGVLSVVLVLLGIGWVLGRGSGGSGTERKAEPASSARADGGLAGLHEREFNGTNLEQIAKACRVYAKANGGRLPTYAAQLRPLFGARFAALMDVPETPEHEASGYVVRMGLELSMPDDTPIAFEAATRPDGKRGVVYMDGTVRVFPRGDPELKRALAR